MVKFATTHARSIFKPPKPSSAGPTTAEPSIEDFVQEGPDGKYILSPAQSPENWPGNSDSQATFNATMDVAAVKELAEYAIAENGIIKEWLTPKLENHDAHRHSSQLYALYDGLPGEIAESPQRRCAFIKSVEDKLERYWKDNERRLTLPAGHKVKLAITLK